APVSTLSPRTRKAATTSAVARTTAALVATSSGIGKKQTGTRAGDTTTQRMVLAEVRGNGANGVLSGSKAVSSTVVQAKGGVDAKSGTISTKAPTTAVTGTIKSLHLFTTTRSDKTVSGGKQSRNHLKTTTSSQSEKPLAQEQVLSSSIKANKQKTSRASQKGISSSSSKGSQKAAPLSDVTHKTESVTKLQSVLPDSFHGKATISDINEMDETFVGSSSECDDEQAEEEIDIESVSAVLEFLHSLDDVSKSSSQTDNSDDCQTIDVSVKYVYQYDIQNQMMNSSMKDSQSDVIQNIQRFIVQEFAEECYRRNIVQYLLDDVRLLGLQDASKFYQHRATVRIYVSINCPKRLIPLIQRIFEAVLQKLEQRYFSSKSNNIKDDRSDVTLIAIQ
ncbi:unnamed protein product, partial [Didymodactylos carnosus]